VGASRALPQVEAEDGGGNQYQSGWNTV